MLKNWYFWIVVLKKTLESPLDSKEIKPVNPKGNQSWKFIRRTDAEAAAPILWPHDVKSWLIGKDSDVGKDWSQEEKWATGDKMVWWHHWLNGHEFEHTLGDSERQGNLVWCASWGQTCLSDWTTTRGRWRILNREVAYFFTYLLIYFDLSVEKPLKSWRAVEAERPCQGELNNCSKRRCWLAPRRH